MADGEDPWADHVRAATPPPVLQADKPVPALESPTLDAPSEAASAAAPELPPAASAPEQPLGPLGEVAEVATPTALTFSANDSALPVSEAESQASASGAEVQDEQDDTSGSRAREAEAERANDEGAAEDDSDEEAFVYPGSSEAAESEEPVSALTAPASEQAESSGAADAPLDSAAPAAPAVPLDHATLASLSSTGPLSALKAFFAKASADGHSSFVLANEPGPNSGLVPLHYAAREGKADIVRWLIEEAGALVELEDKEGETALHKAALAGRLPALTFLLSRGASANAVDFDGWTPLHNACARGYLDIVRVLCENAEAIADAKGGRGEWTPLMNAAAGGHVTVVRYLCAKSQADPFARNTAGETAYDIAAATFETYVCEVLEKYEAERWAALRFSHEAGSSDAPQARASAIQQAYNPLRLHSTVPIILHENQRLDTRLSTLAVHGGKPRWSGTSAGRPHKPDRRAPGTMPPGPLSTSRTRNAPMRREDVGLPLRENPYKLVLPTRAAQVAAANARMHAAQNQRETEFGSTPTPQSVLNGRAAGSSAPERQTPDGERCHFWLSDWQPDLTHPLVDAHDGWQYAQSFDAPDERWSAAVPPPLARLLEGRGLGSSVTRAITGGVLPGPGQTPVNGSVSGEQEAVPTGWVRRRRWVRVIRRRLDIDFGDELEAAEIAQYSSAVNAGPGASLKPASVVAAEQEAREACSSLGPSADYVARARALAGLSAASGSTPADAMGEGADELRRRIARLDLAISELRGSAFSDADSDRQSRAEDMLKEYTLQLGQLRQAIGIDEGSDDEDSDGEEFIYPNSYKDDGQSVITRIGLNQTSGAAVRPGPPVRVGSSASAFGAAAPSEAGVSFAAMRSADLAAATEFRVPTHEVPNRFSQPVGAATLREQNLVPTWQSDDSASECPDCQRRFTFFVRKHHCRRCGQIRCDRCSSHRVQLSAAELVIDPAMPEMLITESSGPTRICNACNADRQLPPGTAVRSLLSQLPSSQAESDFPSSLSDVSSRASELNECPVCSTTLATLGDSVTQEEHVRTCLETGGGGSLQGGRYLVYKLPDQGPIVGKECVICLEDLLPGMIIARLPCLCYFHRACIDSWFSRGKACPTHARTW